MAAAQTSSSSIVDQCRDVLTELYSCRENEVDKTSEILSRLRVLTREKTLPPDVIDKNCIKTLVANSSRGQTEAQKCLSNLILNYAHLRDGLVELYVSCLEERLMRETHEEPEEWNIDLRQRCEVLYYDLRIIFLLSALCPNSRSRVRDRLLEPIMSVTYKEADRINEENYSLVIESLRTLFNLTMDKCLDAEGASRLIRKLFSVTGTGHELLSGKTANKQLDDTNELLVDLINLLTNMPAKIYCELSDEDVDKVLNLLDKQLKSLSNSSFRETVLPVLNACANICRHKENVRQRWFDEIIGSTKEFEKRPEEYDTLRGRLVKLMTSVDVHIKDIAAEFLHALCGDNTEKFITYTGFGNSAAYLATRGLLGQDSAKISISEAETTSDHRYQALRGRLDPITGRVEQPKANPMEGMSEEEKEWHAHELANAIAKLSNLGVIKPMQVGDDNQITELKPRERNKRD